GFGAAQLTGHLRAAFPGRLRVVVPACAALAMFWATTFNAYEYFVELQNGPDVDNHSNLRARQLCETVRRASPIQFYYTYDLDYWCAAQCAFLIPGGLKAIHVVRAPDLQDTRQLRDGERPALVVV